MFRESAGYNWSRLLFYSYSDTLSQECGNVILLYGKDRRPDALVIKGSQVTRLSEHDIRCTFDLLDGSCIWKNVKTNVNFEQIYEQIQYFYKIRGICHLHVKINGESFDEDQKERFVSLFENWTDSINIDHIVNVWPGLEITHQSRQMYNQETVYPKASTDGRKIVCPQMFYELLIHSDGTISPCCVDYRYKEENLGNVYESNIREIWNGSRLKSLRVQELRGENSDYSSCNKCSYSLCGATVEITSCRDELLKKYGA